MRNIINISLPTTLVREVKVEVKRGGYASTSEFFRHLLRLWRTKQLGEELRRDRQDFIAGKGKILRSLKDLE